MGVRNRSLLGTRYTGTDGGSDVIGLLTDIAADFASMEAPWELPHPAPSPEDKVSVDKIGDPKKSVVAI